MNIILDDWTLPEIPSLQQYTDTDINKDKLDSSIRQDKETIKRIREKYESVLQKI